MEIMPLKDRPEYKDQVIEWLNQEFGCEKSYHFYKELIERSMVEDEIPITFIAVDNDVLVGTVGLWRGDLLSRQDLYPWLSALFVNPEYRNQNIGMKLQDFIVEYCIRQKYEAIYLYTDLKHYYEKNGWSVIGKGYEYMGGEVTIYQKSLAASEERIGRLEHLDVNVDRIIDHVPKIVDFDTLKKFAVAITLVETERGTEIIFEERAHSMAHQPGDICFPGGKVEQGETPKEAAIRELSEELLIDSQQMEVLGDCDIYLTGKGAVIYPFVVKLYDYKNTFSKDEVEEIFTVPIAYFKETEPKEVFTTIKEIPDEDFPYERIYGGKNYPWREHRKRIVFYEYEGKTIWGMTGRMMEHFAKTFLD